MLKPTVKNQKKWVKEHLNNGVLLEDEEKYEKESSYKQACYDGLVWLEKNNIKTLEEAWDKCNRPDWLMWMLMWMSPNRKDLEKLDVFVKHCRKYYPFIRLYPVDYSVKFVELEFESVMFELYVCCQPRNLDKTPNEDLIDRHKQYRISKKIKEIFGNPWKM